MPAKTLTLTCRVNRKVEPRATSTLIRLWKLHGSFGQGEYFSALRGVFFAFRNGSHIMQKKATGAGDVVDSHSSRAAAGVECFDLGKASYQGGVGEMTILLSAQPLPVCRLECHRVDHVDLAHGATTD